LRPATHFVLQVPLQITYGGDIEEIPDGRKRKDEENWIEEKGEIKNLTAVP